jgi:hypothetical protein
MTGDRTVLAYSITGRTIVLQVASNVPFSLPQEVDGIASKTLTVESDREKQVGIYIYIYIYINMSECMYICVCEYVNKVNRHSKVLAERKNTQQYRLMR